MSGASIGTAGDIPIFRDRGIRGTQFHEDCIHSEYTMPLTINTKSNSEIDNGRAGVFDLLML